MEAGDGVGADVGDCVGVGASPDAGVGAGVAVGVVLAFGPQDTISSVANIKILALIQSPLLLMVSSYRFHSS